MPIHWSSTYVMLSRAESFKLLLVMVNFYVATIEHFCPYKLWLKPKLSLAELWQWPKARLRLWQGLSSQKLSPSRGFQAEPSRNITILTLSPLLSPINSYSTLCICTSTPTPVPIPIVDNYLSPIVNDLCILKSSTLDSYLCSYLSHIRQTLDTWGHVHAILWHPPHHMDSR
jgi:hypothetical protein